ncbi:MAG: hypothetical protein PVG32_17575 [Anaerolineales bacterium]
MVPPQGHSILPAQAAQVGVETGFQARLAVDRMVVAQDRAEGVKVAAGVITDLTIGLHQGDTVTVEKRPALDVAVSDGAAGVVGAGEQIRAAVEGPPAAHQRDGGQTEEEKDGQITNGEWQITDSGGRPPFCSSGPRADVQQEQGSQERHQQGGTTVGNERQGHTGERQQAQTASHNQHALGYQVGAQASSQVTAEGVRAAQGSAQPPLGEQRQHQHQSDDADQPCFLSDGGEDEIGVRYRHHPRGPQTRAAPQQAPVGDRQQGLHDLIGAPAGVQPRVEPGIHPQAHHVEELVADHAGQDQTQPAQRSHPAPARGAVDHDRIKEDEQ